MDLSRVADREALTAQREPHWQRLSPGRFLGYRPSAKEGAGTSIARIYDEGGRKYRLQALGDFGAMPPPERFQAAKQAAETLAALIEHGGAAKAETVKDAASRHEVVPPVWTVGRQS